MRLPDWLRVKRTIPPVAPAPHGTVTVEIAVDMAKFVDGLTSAGEAARKLGRKIELWLCRLEVSAYVAGGLDPAFADPAARDAEVRRLATSDIVGVRRAAAFLRGWVEHHPAETAGPFVLHTLWSRHREAATPVEVSAS